MVADDLTVVRQGKVVLKEVQFTVQPGKITGLIGPSGSGKTTLIRSIVGAQLTQHGSLQVLGKPAGSKELRARIGYVSQTPAIYQDLTVRQNLQYFAAILHQPKARIREMLKLVDLIPQEHQLVSSLSGGQCARVSLAIALLGNAQLLVLDEPTVGLDPVLRRKLWALFAQLAADGRTLLISSHVMDEAEQCQDLLLLRDGQVLSHGSKQQLLERTHAKSVEDAFLQLIAKGGGRAS